MNRPPSKPKKNKPHQAPIRPYLEPPRPKARQDGKPRAAHPQTQKLNEAPAEPGAPPGRHRDNPLEHAPNRTNPREPLTLDHHWAKLLIPQARSNAPPKAADEAQPLREAPKVFKTRRYPNTGHIKRKHIKHKKRRQ